MVIEILTINILDGNSILPKEKMASLSEPFAHTIHGNRYTFLAYLKILNYETQFT